MSQTILENVQGQFNGIKSEETAKGINYAKQASEEFINAMALEKARKAQRVTMQEMTIDPKQLKEEIESDCKTTTRPTAGEITNQPVDASYVLDEDR